MNSQNKIFRILFDKNEAEAIEEFKKQQNINQFLELIKHRDQEKLKNLLNSLSDVTLEQAVEGIILAANIEAWSCIPIIMNYVSSIKTSELDIKALKARLAPAMLIATRKNHLSTVTELLSYHPTYEQRAYFSVYTDQKFKKSAGLLYDDYNSYTALHWATHHDNPQMCHAILRAWNHKNIKKLEHPTYTKGRHPSGWHRFDITGYTDLCLAQDNQRITPFSLAMLNNRLESAKAIARFHDWHVVHTTCCDDVVFKTMQHDIKFGYITYNHGHSHHVSDFSNGSFSIADANTRETDWLTDDNREHFYQRSLSLPTDERLHFLEQARDSKTAFGSLFAANDPTQGNTVKAKIKKDLDIVRGITSDLPTHPKNGLTKGSG